MATLITLTYIGHQYQIGGRLIETYADNDLLLRTARKVGDSEPVNNFVLGQLRKAKGYGAIDFTELKK